MTLESVGKACGVALRRWLLVYAAVVHLFVVWNWNPHSVSPHSRTVMDQSSKKLQEIDETAEWTLVLDQTRSSLDATEADIRQLKGKKAQLEEKLQRIDRSMDTLLLKQKELSQLETKLVGLPVSEELRLFQDGEVAPDEYFDPFQDLLSIPDLAEISNTEELERSFDLVLKSMENYMQETGRNPNWSALNDMLQRSYPSKESKISACPVIPEDEEDETALDDDEEEDLEEGDEQDAALTEDDMNDRLAEIRGIRDSLYDKDRLLPVSDDEFARLETVRQRLVDEWIGRVEDALDDIIEKVESAITTAEEEAVAADLIEEVDEDENTCSDTNDIKAILEAGIQALYSKTDLQESLHAAMIDRDPDLSEAILDAQLPLSGKRPKFSKPETLRQYLDTALLAHDVPEWIHALLDTVGGYNDAVDGFIDNLPDDAGERAVRYLLDLAGNVNLKHIQGGVEKLLVARDSP